MMSSHLSLQLLQQLGERILVSLLLRPLNAQTFLLIRLWNHVDVNMVDDLVCNATVVL